MINHCDICRQDKEFNTKLVIIHPFEIGNIVEVHGENYRRISGIRESHLFGICADCRQITNIGQIYDKLIEKSLDMKSISFYQEEFNRAFKPEIPEEIMKDYHQLANLPTPRSVFHENRLCQVERDIRALENVGFIKPKF